MAEQKPQCTHFSTAWAIGAPLVAMVQAEVQSARATVEYIREVGFVGGDEGTGSRSESDQRLGDLRMARFTYVKPDESGGAATYQAEVPLLSLVPIPGIRIKQAKVGFTAKINDAYTEEASGQPATRSSLWLRPALTQFRGSLTSKTRSKEEVRGAYELDIELEVEQMPIAPGLEKLLMTFDEAINDQKQGEG